MLTRLFNHTVAIYSSSYTRDDRGGIPRSRALKYSNVVARVEIYSPRKLTRQQQFNFGSRQIIVDYIIYTEQTGIVNGDDVEYPEGSGQFMRIEGIMKFEAQGGLPEYSVLGAIKIEI